MRTIYRIDGSAASPSPLAIKRAADELRAGALALLPTETVYGVGVSVAAFAGADPAAAAMPAPVTGYRRIFSLKHRDLAQTVAWLVDGPAALDVFGVGVDARTRELARAFWPGALTLIVKASPAVPSFMQAADGTVALRASACPAILNLIAACGSPLAVTSANTHGAPAPASFAEVEPRVLAGVDVAIDAGPTRCRDASTIVSLASGEPRILRQGALAEKDILEALGLPADACKRADDTIPRASGLWNE